MHLLVILFLLIGSAFVGAALAIAIAFLALWVHEVWKRWKAWAPGDDSDPPTFI